MLSIKIDDLLKIQNPNIIDIRSEQSYNNNHIPNSKNVPYEKLLTNYKNYLDRNKKYYIYCQKGIMSARICGKLSSMGYNVASIIGGYEAWILKEK